MDSKTRTRILYEDPNSMFKANKRVYLHELQGSTLKSTQPFPNDITQGLKTSELVVTLISKLTAFTSITDYIYSTLVVNEIPLTPVSFMAYIKDGNSLSVSIKNLITKLLKMPQSAFKEDDVFSINSLYTSIKTTFEYLEEMYDNVPGDEIGQIMTSVTFGSFYDKLSEVVNRLEQLIQQLTGSSNVIVREFNPNVEAADVEFQDAQEGPPELVGAGRFNRVLSSRIRKIQKVPYKRFL